MASIRTTLELANQQFMSAIRESESAVKNFQTNLQTAGSAASSAFGGMAAAAAGLAATLLLTGRQVITFADEITDLATAHETTVTNVLALGAALQANGGHADRLGKMFLEMSKGISEIANGNLKTEATFNKLGVTIGDIATASEDDIRNKLIKGLADIKDPAERAAAAFSVFGKGAAGVDFTKLGASIEENSKKYAQHEDALKSAGDAYDKLGQIATDTKIAFAEAFKPAFDMIAKLNPSIDTLTIGFKAMGTALVVITGAAIARGVWTLVSAFTALRVAILANPLLAIASVLATLGVTAATYFGAFDSGTTALDNNSKATDTNTAAAEKNNKVNRDISERNNAVQKQLESLTKITEAFNLQTAAISRKLNLELQGLTQSEEQRKVSQQVTEIEVGREKALLDLKTQYNNLNAQGRGMQKSAYEEQQLLIKRNADLEISAARELIALQDTRKKQILDRVNGLKTLGSAEEEVFKLQQQMTPKSGAEQIQNDVEINAALERRKLLLEKIIATNKGVSLYDVNEGLLGSTEDLSFAVQTLVNRYKDLPGVVAMTKEEFIKLRQENAEQFKAIDESARAIGEQKQKVFDQQRSFGYGWEKAFKEYADNATNAAQVAQNIFTKSFKGMEDALVNFAKTGKFTWKNFINMMLEELLRAQIQTLFARMLGSMSGSMKAGGGGGGLLGGLLGGAGSLLGGLFGGGKAGGGGAAATIGGGLLSSIFGGTPAQRGPTPTGGNLSSTTGLFSGISNIFSSEKTPGAVPTVPQSQYDQQDMDNGSGSDFNFDISSFDGFARGGRVRNNRPIIVGERGPEIIAGMAGREVIPNNQLGGTTVTYNINAVDAQSFQSLLARDPQFLFAVTEQGRKSIPGAR